MENFIGMQRALNGALRLDAPTGVRVLVVVSDGQYTISQREQGDKMLKRLMESGCKVLWIGFNGEGRDAVTKGAQYVRLTDPSRMGQIIGSAMVELLERA